MPTCPAGHASRTADYCDECGAPMNGTGPAVIPAGVPGGAPIPPPNDGGWFTPPPSTPCPECGEPLNGTFCEACGWGPGVGPAIPSQEVKRTQQYRTIDPNAPWAPSQQQPSQPAAPPPPPQPVHVPGPWQALADADRAYFERTCAANDIDPATMRFPEFCPQRRFRLFGTQLLIGRRSASKGIEPEIDLTGPPTDAAVSHAHAMLIALPDGRWAVVDVGSSNGTYVNESTQPLARNAPRPLELGDRVHIGLWTTLTMTSSGM